MTRILVVDNNRRDAEKNSENLRDYGYDVTIVYDGCDGVEALRKSVALNESPYRVIITDLTPSSCGPIRDITREISPTNLDYFALIYFGKNGTMGSAEEELEKVSGAYKGIPLIAVTKRPNFKRSTAIKMGFNAVLQKPVTQEELREILEELQLELS